MTPRRAVLKWLAASPLVAAIPAMLHAFAQGGLVTSAAEALDVFDLELAAQRILPPAHWGFLAAGVDGEDTLKANREGFAGYQLRTRRFVDVSRTDLSTELLGMKLASPIVLCPVSSQKAFHPEGEIAVARAAKAHDHLQILSTVSTTAIEDVIRARGGPVWYQLYPTNHFDVTARLLHRAEAAGCPVVAVSADLPVRGNAVTQARFQRLDARVCASCHAVGPDGARRTVLGDRPMFAGIDTQGVTITAPSLTWEFIARLKNLTRMKVVIKGLETGEDARLAVKHGADGIIVSNHGGRATESGRASIDALSDIVQAVEGRIPVLVDGGVRRGTDVFKALALGATAVGIGRPYIWGLSAFGQPGVERVLDILNNELRLAMVGCGASSLKDITRASISGVEPRR